MEEPPFYWTGSEGKPIGADIEIAEYILSVLGYTRFNYQLTTFGEIIPGLAAGRWNMNVPIFVTPERSAIINFSIPVWANGDGFIVAAGNPKKLDSYASVTRIKDAKIAVMPDTIQLHAAIAAGVDKSQIFLYECQEDAINALLDGKVDAYAATALGNRNIVQKIGPERVISVAHKVSSALPVGAFSFAKSNTALKTLFNEQLRHYLGSSQHRQVMAKYGFGESEIAPILALDG